METEERRAPSGRFITLGAKFRGRAVDTRGASWHMECLPVSSSIGTGNLTCSDCRVHFTVLY